MKLRTSAIKMGLTLALSVGATSAWAAQISSNLTATSNYIWRGVTQTNDEAAVQGGVDYTINKHFYTGAWTSNVTGDYELDLYGGYTNKFGEFDFDAGLITYQYPGSAGIDDLPKPMPVPCIKTTARKYHLILTKVIFTLKVLPTLNYPINMY